MNGVLFFLNTDFTNFTDGLASLAIALGAQITLIARICFLFFFLCVSVCRSGGDYTDFLLAQVFFFTSKNSKGTKIAGAGFLSLVWFVAGLSLGLSLDCLSRWVVLYGS